ncbi:Translation initiation factor 6 [uncultured archaeon]|nr:Translation initiation factor 6 [uncultured archaeon]
MYFYQTRVDGEDFVGLLAVATDAYAVISPGFKGSEVFGVPTVQTKIYGTKLIGLFAVGNSNGLLLPSFTSDGELADLRKKLGDGVQVERIEEEYNTLCNFIAANDKGCLASREFAKNPIVKDVLDVEIVEGKIRGHPEVGSYLAVTNKGFLAHPHADDQLKDLESILKVPGKTGSVNQGLPFIRAGLAANSNGYVTGLMTTGIELNRIEEALGFL